MLSVPHAVEKFSTTQVGNTSINVAWNAPRVSTGPVLRYRVRWKNSTASGEEDTPSNSTRYKMQHLSPYVHYNLKALAITEAGPGPWSKEVTVRTEIGSEYCMALYWQVVIWPIAIYDEISTVIFCKI